MPEKKLSIRVSATDEASPVINGVAQTAKTAASGMAKMSEADREARRNAARVDRNWELAEFEKFKQQEAAEAKAAALAEAEQAKKIASDAARQAAEEGAGGGVLESLKSEFGRGGKFTQIAKLFAGGGAILGLGLAAREIQDMGEKAKALAEGLADGSIKAAEIPEHLVEALPIVGDLYIGIKDVALVMSGIAGDQTRANIEAKITQETTERLVQSTRELAQARREAADMAADIAEKADANLAPPSQKAVADAQADADSAKQKAETEEQGKKSVIEADRAKKLQDLHKKEADELQSLNDAVAAAQKNLDSSSSTYAAVYQQKLAEAQAAVQRVKDLYSGQEKAINASSDEDIKAAAIKRGETEQQADADLAKAKLDRQREAQAAAVKDQKDFARESAAAQAEASLAGLREAVAAANTPLEKLQRDQDLKQAEIKAKLAQDIEEIHQTAAQKTREFPENASQYASEAHDEIARKQGEAARAGLLDWIEGNKELAAAKREAADHEAEIQQQLSQQRLDLLKQEAAAGDAVAAAEVKRVEIADQLNEKKRQLQQIINDPRASLPDRFEAAVDVFKLPGQQKDLERQQAAKDLLDVRIAALKREGEEGNRLAKSEADRLEIARQFNEEKAKLREIIAGTTDAQQRADAQALLDSSGERQRKAELAAAPERPKIDLPDKFGENATRLTGADEKALRNYGAADPNLGKAAADPAQKAADTAQGIKDDTGLLADFLRDFIIPNGSAIAQLIQQAITSGGQDLFPAQ